MHVLQRVHEIVFPWKHEGVSRPLWLADIKDGDSIVVWDIVEVGVEVEKQSLEGL